MNRVTLVAALLVAVVACSDSKPEPTPPPPTVSEAAPAPAAARRQTASELSNTIRWATSNEAEVFGYDVFRGETPEGPFFRQTQEPIRRVESDSGTGEYAWVDDSIEAGRSYWYYVEAVTVSGQKAPITPIRHAPPKAALATGPPP